LVGVSLVSRGDLDGAIAAELFASPGSAIEAMTTELLCVWDRYRAADWAERRTGTLDLASGAYLQWIGYADRVVVECSSNTYLNGASRLSVEEELTLVSWGFAPPDDRAPNFYLEAESRAATRDAAFAVVAALTAVFGVYAG
jgi:hypothetical protein